MNTACHIAKVTVGHATLNMASPSVHQQLVRVTGHALVTQPWASLRALTVLSVSVSPQTMLAQDVGSLAVLMGVYKMREVCSICSENKHTFTEHLNLKS